MNVVFFYSDPDVRSVAEGFRDDLRANLGGKVLPLKLHRTGESLMCAYEDENNSRNRQMLPLRADPGEPYLDAFLQEQGAIQTDCYAVACWVWAEGRSFSAFATDLAELCAKSIFINQSSRRLVLYIAAPMRHIPQEWKTCRDTVIDKYGWPALRSIVLVTDHAGQNQVLSWPDEPLEQLRIWLWASLTSRPDSDDLKHDFWPHTGGSEDAVYNKYYCSIGACAKPLYNRTHMERFYQSALFTAVKKAGETAQQKANETDNKPNAGLANLITLVPALLEDRSKQQLKKHNTHEIKSLPLKTKKIEIVLQKWHRTACNRLEAAAAEYRLAFTKPEGIAEILRREVHDRFKKYMGDLGNLEKRILNSDPGVALWYRLPAHIEDIRRTRDGLTDNSKNAWQQWKRIKDISINDAKEAIEQARKKALEEFKEWTITRLIKWVCVSLVIPAAAGGIYITLSSFLNQKIPVKPWLVSTVLSAAGALAAVIPLCIWISKRSNVVERLHNSAQNVFNDLHNQFAGVATQLCESNAGKLNRIMRGILEERMHQWVMLCGRRDALMLPPPAADEAYRSLDSQKQEQIKKSLETCWRAFIAQLSFDKPVLTQWESSVEKPWRHEISDAVNSQRQNMGLTDLQQKIDSLQNPLPLARYHNDPNNANRILLLPHGADKTAVRQEIHDTEIACAGPGHALVKIAYRSGSHEQYDFGESDDNRNC